MMKKMYGTTRRSHFLRPKLILSAHQHRLLRDASEKLTSEQKVRFAETVRGRLFGRVTDEEVLQMAATVRRAIVAGQRLIAKGGV